MTKINIYEAAVADLETLYTAVANGANRIELNARLDLGGITPAMHTIQTALDFLNARHIPLVVMVRPRGGDFTYNTAEVANMVDTIHHLKSIGVQAVTFGAVRQGQLDIPVMTTLLSASEGLEVVMHMAFDAITSTEAQITAMQWLNDHGVHRILTHGSDDLSQPLAITHLQELLAHTPENMTLLIGGSVTADNAQFYADTLNIDEVHGTKIVPLTQ